MAFCTVLSLAICGLEVEKIRVEADVSNGLPMFHMVGYLSGEVKEAAERVRTAIRNMGVKLPAKKIIVNLAPATVKKKGASFDLPIALAVLAALEYIPEESLKDVIVLGELSLDGKIHGISGVLPMIMEAKRMGNSRCILTRENVNEGALVEGIQMIPAGSLEEICGCLNEKNEKQMWKEMKGIYVNIKKNVDHLDFSEIHGQKAAKRAAEIAVAGGHNLLMVGPPGAGKSMIAQRIATILPEISREESLEITKIYSVLGKIDKEYPLITDRPFRSVHHTVTKTALLGGGLAPRPGEISMAHRGVLFLDELAEFPRSVLEVLRQPLEERRVHISRNYGSFVFPAEFMLVAAMNPCPCGNYPDMQKCNCTPGQIERYIGKISQPFLDRMDLCIEMPRIKYEELEITGREETSEEIRDRITKARKIQKLRYTGRENDTNALLGSGEIGRYVALGKKEKRLMEMVFDKMGLTARTYHKILRVARTIADLEENEFVTETHLKEAIGYRSLDKKYWGR